MPPTAAQKLPTRQIDEALLVVEMWASAIEIARQSTEVQQSKERVYRQQLHNTLLAAVSHEFRTPLSAILLSASSMIEQRQHLSEPEWIDRLSIITRETQHLSEVTHHILELSRLEAGESALYKNWETVEEIVGIVIHRLRAHHPHLQILTRIADALPMIQCDAVLIAQLLENLLLNALRYTTTGFPEIHAWCDPNYLKLAVRDHGPGVNEGLRERLFEPFLSGNARASTATQGHAHPAFERKGFGIGLALCRAIAKAHGGDITLEATAPTGSSFLLTLPLTKTAPAIATEHSAPA